MRERTYTYLGIAVVLITVAWGIFQWFEREGLVLHAEELSQQTLNLSGISDRLTGNYQDLKAASAKIRESSAQEIALVFPTKEDLTNLTRLFDDFSTKNNFESNPFFISNLTYQTPLSSDEGAYRYVPVVLTVETSRKNLSKFLEFVEQSGSLEGEARLMSVEDISIKYPSEFGGEYEARITLDAFFSQEL